MTPDDRFRIEVQRGGEPVLRINVTSEAEADGYVRGYAAGVQDTEQGMREALGIRGDGRSLTARGWLSEGWTWERVEGSGERDT